MRLLLSILILLPIVNLAQDMPDSLVTVRPVDLAPVDTLIGYPAMDPIIGWDRQRSLGLGMMLVFGGLAYAFNTQAEDAYSGYLRAGSYAEMDRLFEKAGYYDRLVGWSYLGFEIGFVLTVFSFDRPWLPLDQEVQE
jgi:hypothetical protein